MKLSREQHTLSVDCNVTAPVLDIQRFSLHDGPGIRTLVFLKGCPLKCDWCQNPESQNKTPVLGFYKRRCNEFFECRAACPQDAILSESHRIDREKCNICLACVEACPGGAIKLLGRHMNTAEVLEAVLSDRDYYAQSGGGVTLSGGEPLLHPDFVRQLLSEARAHEIHSVIETCGHFRLSHCLAALQAADLVYFDLKLADPKRHRASTGVSNKTILFNAAELVRRNMAVEFRIPLVPGITDGEGNLSALAHFLLSIGTSRVHLLPYHNMGESKIDVIGGTQKRLGLSSYSDAAYADAAAFMRVQGLTVADSGGIVDDSP